MTKDEALRLALEALYGFIPYLPLEHDKPQCDRYDQAITAIKATLEAKDEPWEKFCDSNCVWTDHHPDCKLAKDEPVAWVGLNLDNMAEAFHRVIEEHHSRKNPFHDPVNGDAMIALRELRGLIAYMKRNTTPPQRTWVALTDEEISDCMEMSIQKTCRAIEAKLKEKNT